MFRYFLSYYDTPKKDRNNKLIVDGVFIMFDENEINKKICLSNIAYTTDIEDIKKYRLVGSESDESLDASEKSWYKFVSDKDLTEVEKEYILYGGEITEYIDDILTREYGDITKERMEEILMSSLKHTFTHEKIDPWEYFEHDYWDGYSWKKIILGDNIYNDFSEFTDELECMEEIDKYNDVTSRERLYKTKSGKKIFIITSFHSGVLSEYVWVDRNVRKIEEIY